MKNIFSALKKVKFRNYTIIYVLVALFMLFWIANPVFASPTNLFNIVKQNTYFLIAAVGMSFVMIGGGIDLSVGYQMSLVGIVTAVLIVTFGLPIWLVVIVALVFGAILGAINGLIVTNIKIFPLIATLATATIFQGISFIISQARSYRLDHSLQFLIQNTFLGIPFDVLLTIIIIILASFIYRKTFFGRFVFATGGNEEASRLAGIKTKLVRISIYSICGFFFAIATLIMMAKANVMQSTFGPGTEFTALTAAIIGGISFKGGEGKIWGLVVGVFILKILSNGMQMAGMSTYAQYIVTGVILLTAVGFDEIQKSRRKITSKNRIEKLIEEVK